MKWVDEGNSHLLTTHRVASNEQTRKAAKLSQSSSRSYSRLPTRQSQSARTSRGASERGSGSDQSEERGQERPMLEGGGLSLARSKDLGLSAFQDVSSALSVPGDGIRC